MTDTERTGQDRTETQPSTVHPRERPRDDRQDPPGRSDPMRPDEAYPAGSLPPFTDPAFSSKPATPPVAPDAPDYEAPPKDTEFDGHPEFSQDAAKNEPPKTSASPRGRTSTSVGNEKD